MTGIAITTHNRYEVFKETLKNVKKHSKGCKIVVVDDGSDVPVKEADFRFETAQGIAIAKNKCIELLLEAGCEHLFLLDDDTYPIKDNWTEAYKNAGEPHLMYIFQDFKTGVKLNDTHLVYQNSKIKAHSHARGCLLYYHKSAIEVAGGMNPIFGKWGCEHPNHSERIYNLGLTTFKYMDVVNSHELIYSADEHRAVASTCWGAERQEQIKRNQEIYKDLKNDTTKLPINHLEVNNIILTCLFTKQIDPHRNEFMRNDVEILMPLINSMKGQKIVILHDDLQDLPEIDNVEFIKVETMLSPYWERWVQYYRYLISHPEIDNVFMVDSTDVEMQINPFGKILPNKLYVGYEWEVLGCAYMRKHHPAKFIQEFIRRNANLQLLNAGTLGGHREMVLQFIRKMLDIYTENKHNVNFGRDLSIGNGDMGAFNYVSRLFFGDKIVYGKQVNTRFKGYETNNYSWFRHK